MAQYYQPSAQPMPDLQATSGFANLKMDPNHVLYHYDNCQRKQAQNWATFNQVEKLPKDEVHSSNLQRHDLFPGYVNSKPLSLQKSDNLSRTLEGCTATDKRHYIATSMSTIDSYLKQKNYRACVKFVLDTILYTLRTDLAKVKQVGQLARTSDDLVMVELCAIHSVISYPDFIQIVQVINKMDAVYQPTLQMTNKGFVEAQGDPQFCAKYMPQYRPGVYYNFSDKGGFQQAIGSVSEQEAKHSLRTLVDFMKTKAMETKELTFEPLLTELINKRDEFLF